ncbi:Mu transposase domain-containing protein [Paenibacillus popilliae]|nr:hypothetical protein [Paenibacillus popilliae]
MRKEETLVPVTAITFAHAEQHQRKGSSDGYVSFEANRYTVPFPYISSIVEVQDEKNGSL